MNNEIAPVLDMLEELKQECKVISKAQAELRTTIADPSLERNSNPNQRTSTFCFGGTIRVE